MGDHDAGALEAALSFERFGRYVRWANGDRDQALRLYALNMRLSAALYVPLQMLEVVLRNRMHVVLADTLGPWWFDRPDILMSAHQPAQLRKARRHLSDQRKAETPDRLVAALTFGFWTSMLSPKHEALWQTILHRIARRDDGRGLRRKDFSGPLFLIRDVRNRIAHHEPILHREPADRYADMIRLTRWMSPSAADWCEDLCAFNAVYPTGGLALRGAPGRRLGS